MRVTQQTMYDSMLNGMQGTLADYMESMLQSSTQKRVNRPSDDPAGAANILDYRSSIALTTQHIHNTETAQGWLSLATQTLGNVSTTITRIRELTEQAATDTYNAEQRKGIATEIRQLLGSIMNQANTEFNGRQIFAGQDYNESSFDEGLAVTQQNLVSSTGTPPQVTGTLSYSAMVRFQGDGSGTDTFTIPPAVGGTAVAYEYTLDGGETWQTGTINPPATADEEVFFDVGGARVTFPQGSSMEVKGYGTAENLEDISEGSSLVLRPSMIYNGADNEATAAVNQYGTVAIPPSVDFSTTGTFPSNVLMRFDDGVDLGTAGEFAFSYSLDNGSTWIEGNMSTVQGTPPTARLVVPGGFVDIDSTAVAPDNQIPAGAQINIQPQRTSVSYEIAPGQTIDVSNVGKDIFGGLYYADNGDNLESALGGDLNKNLFETIGQLIGNLETNNVDAIGEALEYIDAAHAHLLTENAAIGGKLNRMEVTLSALDTTQLNQMERKSNIEDIDLTELLINLSKQETAYQSVLKSSSTIMGMTLMDYI